MYVCVCVTLLRVNLCVSFRHIAQRNIPSNRSDEWENMTTKKAYIENWLQDPQFPAGDDSTTPTAAVTSPTEAQDIRGKSLDNEVGSATAAASSAKEFDGQRQ